MKRPKQGKERPATAEQGRDLSGIHTWLVLWKASQSVGEMARKDIATRGLGVSDFGVLEALLHKGPQPVNEIGKRVLLTSGSMTAAINRLQHKGFVIRKDHPTDHRTWIVHLTAAGRRWIEKAFAAHSERMETAFSPLETRERATLQALLRKLGKAGGIPSHTSLPKTSRPRIGSGPTPGLHESNAGRPHL